MPKDDKPVTPAGTGTKLAHRGRKSAEHHGFVNTPVYRGSTVLYAGADAIRKRKGAYMYGRRGTPTMACLEDLLSELDGAAGCVLSPSGLAAVSTALLSLVKAGDHLLMTDSVYRPARHVCDTVLARMGVETEYYDPLIGAGISRLLRPNTVLVYTEAPGSQTMEMQDISAIANAAKAHGAKVLMDNTWATPLYFRPLEHGVDMAIMAGTKYIIGHSDAMLGAVTATSQCLAALKDTHNTLGMCAGSEEIYLGLRGARTMEVRLRQHHGAGLEIAAWLRQRPEVHQVLHPGLEGAPGHDLWARDFSGASGLFSVVLKPCSEMAVDAFLDTVTLFGLGYSWGGFESLVVPFDPREYRTATRWDAPGPGLRFHIGLEDVDDLKRDLERAFEALNKAARG